MAASNVSYPLSFDVDYPEQRDRLSVLLRLLMVIPIVIVLALLEPQNLGDDGNGPGLVFAAGGLTFLPLVLMLVFRQKYPRWWYDWNLQLSRFSSRVGAYALLLRDEYPSTDEEQAVHL
ncbi:MAG: DUF4389 domain-containing protein, partial [Dehalococcoidia bacterium]|nr:DUF4389 domain-containing protein [Dehalococcoidia bacterium]